MRKMNSFDQIIATLPGWLLKLREQANGTTSYKIHRNISSTHIYTYILCAID